ncbi:uncharacterized protein DFL_007491 [Arthrobotrys flagrans]|uniref:Uncharacterized protein n=1 Tax=Arthrobotrys flagrans TaxID=97331 RepID=A0A436ZVY0_ARTFL|nr:hypothetical protein DFL_007491 [Arthrobotrys flagrans]
MLHSKDPTLSFLANLRCPILLLQTENIIASSVLSFPVATVNHCAASYSLEAGYIASPGWSPTLLSLEFRFPSI